MSSEEERNQIVTRIRDLMNGEHLSEDKIRQRVRDSNPSVNDRQFQTLFLRAQRKQQ